MKPAGAIALVVALALASVLGWMVMPGYRDPATPGNVPSAPELRERLAVHVTRLASGIGERNLWHYAELQAAAGYIEGTLSALGYRVRSQVYPVDGRPVRNIEAEKTGIAQPDEIIVLGAHYDTERGTPGANDNASGVAALLEIARLLRDDPLDRSLRFVAFVNEELPFFQTEAMGSWQYAQRSARRGENIVAMFSLETLGYYSQIRGSQRYPFPFGFFYPDRGNFLAFVGDLQSRPLVRRSLGTFRRHTRFPAEGVSAPRAVPGVAWSDQWAFWRAGYRAVMVTDTALYRYPYYHLPDDVPSRIDYASLAQVVHGLSLMVAELAGSAD